MLKQSLPAQHAVYEGWILWHPQQREYSKCVSNSRLSWNPNLQNRTY